MDCKLEKNEPVINCTFKCKQNKQKILIDLMLQYGSINIEDLADILDLPKNIVQKTHEGKNFLEPDKSVLLGQLFLFLYGD